MNTKKTTIAELEMMARDLAEKTGCTIENARAGIRIEMLRIAVAFGAMTLEAANAELATAGLKISRR